ncbi:DUF6299 family protein [Streptomyces purpureus]|uniref:DUF6299 domain-containing protein n=1 Tax=Streptomyces purpureus TaxID=1951 RepID=A0A918H807_9ACTN|nr:DUF6299 family protein [Streptomyces purpureus]GGT41246.1 hypothetical protein GCM10014713_38690 [Streptomyces purpureus]
MRLRLPLGAAASTLLVAGLAAAAPAHAGPTDRVTVEDTGTVTADGTVTLHGTYQCLDDGSTGPVLVGSTLKQKDLSSGIGGTRAVCDGQVREWTNTAVVTAPGRYEPGPARVQANLMKLDTSRAIPLPEFLAQDDADITLR